jgi:hypothetical protein
MPRASAGGIVGGTKARLFAIGEDLAQRRQIVATIGTPACISSNALSGLVKCAASTKPSNGSGMTPTRARASQPATACGATCR